MQDEKDMIEINLNTPISSRNGKGFNYFGNISLSKTQNGGFPYDQYRNEDEIAKSKQNKKLCVFNEYPQRISCLRQMYCPDCQQRLDDDSVLVGRNGLCCIPVFLMNRFYKICLKREADRRVYCKHCGGDMGYWKQV